jgi:8-oxo-dGTP diphosphatase
MFSEWHASAVVTAAVISRDGRVLIARRPPGGRHPGAWEFPGGKVEPLETARECIVREMAEEMGVRVSAGRRLAIIRHRFPDLDIELVAFDCRIIEGEPEDIGCVEHAWVRPEELWSYDLLPPDHALSRLLPGRAATNG